MRIALAALVCALIALTGCRTVWVAPTGNDSNAGTQTSPKRSFAGACAVPKDSQGRFVLVAPGIYGLQTVPAGCDRTMFVADGGTVTVRNNQGNGLQPTLQNDARDVEFVGIYVDSAFAERQGFGNSGVARFRDAAIGNVLNEKGLLSGSEAGSEYINVLFHDVLIDKSPVPPSTQERDIHNECVYSQTPALVVRNSTFWNCSTMSLMITRGDWWGQPTYGDGVIENNRFFHSTMEAPGSWHHYNLLWNGVMGQATNWTVRNNWFETRVPGNPGNGDIGLDIPWVGGVRCSNTETTGNNVLDAVWKQPC